MTLHVEKNEDEELPVPIAWRPTLCEMVDSFKAGNFQVQDIANVEPIDKKNAEIIRDSIHYYGDKLTSLPDETWVTSIYRWMLDHWEVVIDLFTSGEGRSDLVLFVDVFEQESGYKFKIQSVHVP